MNQKQQKNQKPSVSDNYKGLKKETVVVTITEKNGKVTKIKI
jgi:hypothetical protein